MKKITKEGLKNVKIDTKTILIVVAVLFALSQVITFAQDRKILGVSFKEEKSKNSSNKTSTLPENEDNTGKSKVCKTISEEDVSKLVGKKVIAGAFMADTEAPNLFSSCIYRTSAKENSGKNSRSVTVSLQEKADDQVAKNEMDKLKKQDPEDIDEIEGFGDQAFFAAERGQLTVRKSAKIISVFVKSGDDKAVDIEDTAKELASKLF